MAPKMSYYNKLRATNSMFRWFHVEVRKTLKYESRSHFNPGFALGMKKLGAEPTKMQYNTQQKSEDEEANAPEWR